MVLHLHFVRKTTSDASMNLTCHHLDPTPCIFPDAGSPSGSPPAATGFVTIAQAIHLSNQLAYTSSQLAQASASLSQVPRLTLTPKRTRYQLSIDGFDSMFVHLHVLFIHSTIAHLVPIQVLTYGHHPGSTDCATSQQTICAPVCMLCLYTTLDDLDHSSCI